MLRSASYYEKISIRKNMYYNKYYVDNQVEKKPSFNLWG